MSLDRPRRCRPFLKAKAVLGLVGGDPALATSGTAGAFLAEYGGSFSRFSHGVVHAIFAAILVALPFLAHQAMWSGKSFKAFAIDFCFWTQFRKRHGDTGNQTAAANRESAVERR